MTKIKSYDTNSKKKIMNLKKQYIPANISEFIAFFTQELYPSNQTDKHFYTEKKALNHLKLTT